ncbi:prepilin-type N-terminal cleavage/methylation domain-containing protein [candidate division WOR-3 bacterium]|nr:prepilin-type N-terminal cleavage/methylation domain-containing protein [candidate division WOR-3 bacterium]
MNNKGLTIIELLVTLVISSLIITAAIAFHLANQRIFVKEKTLIEVRSNVRGALDIIVSDLRLAGYNPTQAPVPEFDPAIRDARDDRAFMRADTNSNGTCEVGEETGYRAINNSLYRYVTTGIGFDTLLVAESIDYLGFRYFDTNGDTLTTPVAADSLENIRFVKIIIIGKTPREFSNYHESGIYPDSTPYDDRCYRCWDSTYVKLRNM